jgi:hypothetical protein
MTADQVFAQRAANRLNALLDEQGAPFDLLGRSSLVAQLMQATPQEAQQLLSGKVPWSWTQVARACGTFGRNPGFFLDEHPVPGIPTDTCVVPGADGGETIVWRAPRGFIKNPASATARLRYMTQHDVHGPYPLCSLLVYAEQRFTPKTLTQASAYVIESDSGLEAMRCVDVHDHVASFESSRPGALARVVQYADEASNDHTDRLPRIVGRILASITPQA